MNILVTGGAGFLGSIVVDSFVKRGDNVVVIDNLSTGHEEAVNPKAKLFMIDLLAHKWILDSVFKENKFDAVIHLAAEASIEKSMTNPSIYFNSNVVGGINVLDSMVKYKVNKIIFSSCASLYGNNDGKLCQESDIPKSINSYGESKLMFENILKWYGTAYGIKHITFRFFKVNGSTKEYGESHLPETHLIPNVLWSALSGEPVEVFGTDYNTPDGTCIRDFVHTLDVVQAIFLALDKIETHSGKIYNLSSTQGYSVLDVINATREVTNLPINIHKSARRNGDPSILRADSSLVRKELGWKPQYTDIKDIIKSDWEWQKNHPNGYNIE